MYQVVLYAARWQWNVIMHANIMLPSTLVSNKLNVPFFSTLFQWDFKIVTDIDKFGWIVKMVQFLRQNVKINVSKLVQVKSNRFCTVPSLFMLGFHKDSIPTAIFHHRLFTSGPPLRGNSTPNQRLVCFVMFVWFPKMINTLFEKKSMHLQVIFPEKLKNALKF